MSDFEFFVGDIIMGAGLCISGRGHRALGTNAKSQFLGLILVETRL